MGWSLYGKGKALKEAEQLISGLVKKAKKEIKSLDEWREYYEKNILPTLETLTVFGATDTAVRETIFYAIERELNKKNRKQIIVSELLKIKEREKELLLELKELL